ncbi:MAG: hypothetical protein H6Q23_1001 [Bacteroidetes bacterium]|jgi:hypothetical protein|nr:hypothetical protein [Bacteroidota bacterium]
MFLVLALSDHLTVLNGRQFQAIQPGERVVLICDRNLYIAGERLFFSAFLQIADGSAKTDQGRVLYCEIISPDGNKITGDKYLIENSFASGSVAIPGDIITGTYYLRAYTRFMRNAGPSAYNYTRIKIVNANRSEVQTQTDGNYLSDSLSRSFRAENRGGSFIVSTDKPGYSPRDTVNITIDRNNTIVSSFKGLSLSVVPESSVSFQTEIIPLNDGAEAANDQSENRVFNYAETRGLSVAGKLVDNATGNVLPYTRVNLSVIGKGRDFMAVQTDSAGLFFFSLPDYTGYRDLFLCAGRASSPDPKILVDNDFCTVPVHLPTGTFTLTPQERETAYNMAVNVQLDTYFKVDSIPGDPVEAEDEQAFYGKPDDILYIDDYIQLPTLEEYFNGLPTLVRVRKHKGEKYFKVIGPQAGLNNFDPLIMVDQVAIDDPSKLLGINPANISRIEVINELYAKGDETFGGIINIISRHGDFAGIDLPSSGIFIRYAFLAEESQPRASSSLPPSFPDTRNTLFWDPELELSGEGHAEVSFAVSDTPGRYIIVLSSVNLKGEVSRQTIPFEVHK